MALKSLNQSINDDIKKIICLSNNNLGDLEIEDIYNDDNLFGILENTKKELFFLEKKRRFNYFSSFNKISQQKNESFFIPKSYEFYKNNKENYYFKSQINHEQLRFFEKIKEIQNNLIKEKKQKSLKNSNKDENNDLNLLNKNENKKNLKKHKSNIKTTELKGETCNLEKNETSLININENDQEKSTELNNINNSSNTKIDNNIKNSKKIFNVTLMDGEKGDSNENLFKNYSSNNNEVKVLKNNKVVYVNSSLLNSYYTYKNLKIVDKVAFVGRSKRSSKYRGVSKNGNQWQVLIMLDKNKSYIRSYSSEYIAARVYDILAIKSKGFKARTNFIYDNHQINKIIEMNIDIKAKNINEIILNLFG